MILYCKSLGKFSLYESELSYSVDYITFLYVRLLIAYASSERGHLDEILDGLFSGNKYICFNIGTQFF